MSYTYEWSWLNDDEYSTKYPFNLSKLGEVSNYAVTRVDNERVELSNLTAPLDEAEILTYSCKDIVRVDNKLKLRDVPDATGVQYEVRIDSTMHIVDDDTHAVIGKMPCVVSLLIRHPKHEAFSGEFVDQAVKRVIGATRYWGTNPTTGASEVIPRWDRIMRGQEQPTQESPLN